MKIKLLERPTGDSPITAMVLVLSGVLILALQDTLVKYMAPETSFWQFQTLRSLGNGFLLLCLCAFGSGFALLKALNPRMVFIRAAVMTMCMFCFFAGAPFLSVAQMAAGLYTYPLFVTMLAAPVLGERVGIWRIIALLLGVCGAMVILRPWTSNFTLVQLLPICAGFLYAINILILRRYCRGESPVALTFAVAVMFIISGGMGSILLTIFAPDPALQIAMPFVTIGWPALTLTVLMFAAMASVMNLSGNIFLNRAYQTAESSRLAPLDFTYLLFAVLWGKALFGTWPTAYTFVGMSLIASAGILTAWREHVNARPRKPIKG
ncbi:DMT family transporter [Alphaproteobacteria bacterium]|nr:DMT family transporter [Alphaproteobacteria bacterium]